MSTGQMPGTLRIGIVGFGVAGGALAGAGFRRLWPAYGRERHRQSRYFSLLSRWLGPTFQGRSAFLGWSRDLALPLMCLPVDAPPNGTLPRRRETGLFPPAVRVSAGGGFGYGIF